MIFPVTFLVLLFIQSNAEMSNKNHGNNEYLEINNRFSNMSFPSTNVENIQQEHSKEINEMKNEIGMLKNLVHKLIADKSCNKEANSDIEKKFEAFRLGIMDSLKENAQKINNVLFTQHQNSANQMQTIMNGLHLSDHSKRAGGSSSVTQIAFHAGLTNKLQLIQRNEVLIFDDVHLNMGNHYDHATGKFTASVPGVYVFFATIVSNFASVFRSVIKQNNQVKAYLHSSSISDDYGSASNMAIISLQANDQVWIEAYDGGDGIDSWSDFGGFMLFPELHWQPVG